MAYYIEGYGDEESEDDYSRYRDAVRRLNQLEKALRRLGWDIEVGWASRDNLSAFHATKAGQVRNVQIVRSWERRRGRARSVVRGGRKHKAGAGSLHEHWWTLKLADGRTDEWPGKDAADAVARYQDMFRDRVVVATKPHRDSTHGIFVGGMGRTLTAAEQEARYVRLIATGKAVKAAPPRGRKRRKAPTTHAAAVRRARRR